MRKAILVLIAVLGLWSLSLAAGEFLMNDSGEAATALRVTFSQPVTITGFGDVLMTVEPSKASSTFEFSGGKVEAWGGQWLNWKPEAASIVEYEWLKGIVTNRVSLGEPIQEDLLNSGRLPTTEYRGVNMALEMAHVIDIEYLATEWNANLVRVCLNMGGNWGYFVPTPNAPTAFPESHWERLDRFLNDCEAHGIRVSIDLHQWLGYEYLKDTRTTQIWWNAEYQDSFVEFWGLMAQRYADRGDVIYAYELLNEPHSDYAGGQAFADEWHSLAQRAIDAIREHDEEHAVVIDCTDWGNPSGFSYLRPFEDDNIIYSFHMWVPHKFTHQGVNNSRTGVTYTSGQWNRNWIRDQLAPVLAFQAAHDVRVFTGEIGATAEADPDDRAAYLQDCLGLFEEYGFDYAQWSYMEWGIWSLEHVPNEFPGTYDVTYAGNTEALEVYRSFLAYNGAHACPDPVPRKRCLFDRPGEPGSWEYTVFGGDLLWKLQHAFRVELVDAQITAAELEGVDLLVLGSERASYTHDEINAIDAFVRSGGGLFHYGPGVGDGLEEWLADIGIRLIGGLVVSYTNGWDLGSYFCTAVEQHAITQDVLAFQTNWAAGLELSDGAGALVWSPEESWIDWDHDQRRNDDEPHGPFAIAAAQEIDAGRVVVFGDDAFNLTTNYAITLGALMWLVKAERLPEAEPRPERSDTPIQEHSTLIVDDFQETTEHSRTMLPKSNMIRSAAEQPKLEQRVFDDELLKIERDDNRVYFDIEGADFSELAVHEDVYEVDDFANDVSNLGSQWFQYTYEGENPPMQRGEEGGESFLRLFPYDNIFTGIIHPVSEFDASEFDQLVVNMEYKPSSYVMVGLDSMNSVLEEKSFSSNDLNVSSRRDYVFPFSEMVSEESGESFSGDDLVFIKLFESFGPAGEWNIYSVQFRDEGQLVQAEDGRLSWSMELEPGQRDIQLHLFADNQSEEVDFQVGDIPLIADAQPVTAPEVETSAVETPAEPVAPEINDFYFTSHPAYLMQGVTDRDKIFEMPLDGIPELGVGWMGSDINGDSITWQVISDNPAVRPFIIGYRLYIACVDPTFTGCTSVRVTLTDSAGLSDEVSIPVVVFNSSGILIGSDGRQQYFVSHDPQTDINRISSVQDFCQEYRADQSKLDRSVNFSRYSLMTRLRDISFSEDWFSEASTNNWTWEAQRHHIDSFLDYLIDFMNIDTIRIRWPIYMSNRHSNNIVQVFSPNQIEGQRETLSIKDNEFLYIVNSAHNKGIRVWAEPFIVDTTFSRGEISPGDWGAWFNSYGTNVYHLAELCFNSGVDFLAVGVGLINESGTISDSEWNNRFEEIIKNTRDIFPGPIAYLDQIPTSNWSNIPNWGRIHLWNQVDIIGCGAANSNIANSNAPSYSEVYEYFQTYVNNVVRSLRTFADSPFVFMECGISSAKSVLSNFLGFVNSDVSSIVDLEEQYLFYESIIDLLDSEDWFFGFGWFGLNWAPYNWGGPSDTTSTPIGKPAEDLVSLAYGGNPSSKPFILDGKLEEYSSVPFINDPLGDSTQNRADITQLHLAISNNRLYIGVKCHGGLNFSDILFAELDCNSDRQPDYIIGVFWGGGKYVAGLSNMTFSKTYGFLQVQPDESRQVLEVSLPLSLIGSPNYAGVRVRIEDGSNHTTLDGVDKLVEAPHI
jgi:aryl-phospho-beta-D-glucosidase BglC (GH1 family)